jgi:cytochrome c-type biogenesis protein
MSFGAGTYALGTLAGVLTMLSPCVLPLVPILLAAAVGQHRLGPIALAAGVASSFTVLGVILAAFGARLGLDNEPFRIVAAVLFVAIGMLLVSSRLQAGFMQLTARLTGAGETLLTRFTFSGFWGQFALGALLGVLWTPCVGPTLGAAVTLASRGQNLSEIVLLMFVFGIGASLPLLAIGVLSRAAFTRTRASLRAVGVWGRSLLGVLLIALGVLSLTHADRRLEAWLLDHSPAWVTALTTRY